MYAALMEWPHWSDARGAAVPAWMKASSAERSGWCEKLSVALSHDVDRDGWEYATRFTHIHNPRCVYTTPKPLASLFCVLRASHRSARVGLGLGLGLNLRLG